MLKSSLREHLNLVNRRIRVASPGAKIHSLIGNLIDEFIDQPEKISAQYRMLCTEFNMPYVRKEVFLAHLLVDEYIRLLSEEAETELFRIVMHY